MSRLKSRSILNHHQQGAFRRVRNCLIDRWLLAAALLTVVLTLHMTIHPAEASVTTIAAAQSPGPGAVLSSAPSAVPKETSRPNPYDATTEIAQGKSALGQGIRPAAVLTENPQHNKKAMLTLDGLLDRETMHRILEIVAQHDTTVSFFPSGLQTAEAPDLVKEISSAGYEVGNYTLRGDAYMDALPASTLVEDFAAAQKIYEVVLGKAPTLLKGNVITYTEDVLQAAAASGIQQTVQSSEYLTFHSFKSYEETLGWVNRLKVGSIISVKLSGSLDPSEYQKRQVNDRPALDKAADLSETAAVTSTPPPLGTPSDRVVQLVGWLLQAMDETNYDPATYALRVENQGKLAKPVKELRTTQEAVGYAFHGEYTNANEINGVLRSLQQLKGIGTFFIDETDLAEAPENIRKLIDTGHAIGLSYKAKKQDDYFSISYQLLKDSAALEAQFGVKPALVMQPNGEINEPIKEAASALGLMLVGQDLSFARDDTKGAADPEQVISGVYKNNQAGFQRGSILSFRLGFYEQDFLLPMLLTALEGTRNVYSIVNIHDMATNSEKVYVFPVPGSSILPEVYNRIHLGQLDINDSDFAEFVSKHYIGSPSTTASFQLPGFDHTERRLLDMKGKMKGAQDIAFLTFDDWGSDGVVTRLLRVLKKHDVKATFFVRTEYAVHNPNLLRAIAEDGHEVASHTHTHYPLSNSKEGTKSFEELTDQQVVALREDLMQSWEFLQSVIGDVKLENGNPALSPNFRPPTLAVGRTGFRTVFDLGFQYVVSGSYSSRDYAAQSVEELLKNLRSGVRSGSIVVMHFSDSAVYTAEALDQYLTLNTAGDPKTYTFARLSDYLQPPTTDALR